MDLRMCFTTTTTEGIKELGRHEIVVCLNTEILLDVQLQKIL